MRNLPVDPLATCLPAICLLLAVVWPSLLRAEDDENPAALRRAMQVARQHLDVNMPTEAVAVLEAELTRAAGNRAFLSLLREAYLAELYRLERCETPDPVRSARLRRNLALLGVALPSRDTGDLSPVETKSAPTVPPDLSPEPPRRKGTVPSRPVEADPATEPVEGADTVLDAAVAAFKRGDYATAARLFATAPRLSAEQKAAWTFCRLRLAADRLSDPGCDPRMLALALRELSEALEWCAGDTEMQRLGQALLAAARAKGVRPAEDVPQAADLQEPEVVETASFRVRHSGQADLARRIATAAEQQRKVIFERWSGPPAGNWNPKCDIILHATGRAYSRATGRPSGATGHATVRLTNRQAVQRQIDLRADDPGVVTNSLPRELTHVILADLFPDRPPPKWAETGMAILAGSPEEVGRYTRTLSRCTREGEWLDFGQLFELSDFPDTKITGFYCESVALTEYLIRVGGGERNFTLFLRDCLRYGTAQALRRQYGIDGPEALERNWRREVLQAAGSYNP